MMDLQSVKDRIHALGFAYTGDAVEAADAIQSMAAPVPAAYVSTARESAAPNRLSTGRHSQVVTAIISVLFAVGAQRADAQLRDEVEEWKTKVRDSMIGWTADGANLPFDYISFSIRFMDQGTVWGELLFQTKYMVQKDAA